jgi:hypothetical protein
LITLLLHLVGLYLCVGAAISAFLHKAFTDGLEWQNWLLMIFAWPHLLLEARDV